MPSINFGGAATNFMLYQIAEKKHKEEMLRKDQAEAQKIHQELQAQRTQLNQNQFQSFYYPNQYQQPIYLSLQKPSS